MAKRQEGRARRDAPTAYPTVRSPEDFEKLLELSRSFVQTVARRRRRRGTPPAVDADR